MSTRVMTQTQTNKVCAVLCQMAASLDAIGFPWPDNAQADLVAAFAALGEECPFKFVTRAAEPAEPGDPAAEAAPARDDA